MQQLPYNVGDLVYFIIFNFGEQSISFACRVFSLMANHGKPNAILIFHPSHSTNFQRLITFIISLIDLLLLTKVQIVLSRIQWWRVIQITLFHVT